LLVPEAPCEAWNTRLDRGPLAQTVLGGGPASGFTPAVSSLLRARWQTRREALTDNEGPEGEGVACVGERAQRCQDVLCFLLQEQRLSGLRGYGQTFGLKRTLKLLISVQKCPLHR
jgi:hypothetical protein